MVFQSYALYPHMTVRENMAFGLEIAEVPQGRDRGARRRGPPTCSASTELLDRKPAAALGRPAPARGARPRDRARARGLPLRRAALESRRRAARRRCGPRSARSTSALGATMIYVTHDQVEAMTLGDRIAVLEGGAHPAGRRAARGLRARSTASSRASSGRRRSTGSSARVGDGGASSRPGLHVAGAGGARRALTRTARVGTPVVVGLRPRSISTKNPAPCERLRVRVDGGRAPRARDGRLRAGRRERGSPPASPRRGPETGATLTLYADAAEILLFDAGTGPPAARGLTVRYRAPDV